MKIKVFQDERGRSSSNREGHVAISNLDLHEDQAGPEPAQPSRTSGRPIPVLEGEVRPGNRDGSSPKAQGEREGRHDVESLRPDPKVERELARVAT